MTPSRARGRKVSKRMWGAFCDGKLFESGDREWSVTWSGIFARRSDARKVCEDVRPVTFIYTVPTKPKPRKAK